MTLVASDDSERTSGLVIRVSIDTLFGDTINLNDEEPGSTCERMLYFNLVTEHPAPWGFKQPSSNVVGFLNSSMFVVGRDAKCPTLGAIAHMLPVGPFLHATSQRFSHVVMGYEHS
jgi:hypothetical protein